MAARLDDTVSSDELLAIVAACLNAGKKKRKVGQKVLQVALFGGGVALVATGMFVGWALIGVGFAVGQHKQHLSKKKVVSELEGYNEQHAVRGLQWHVTKCGELVLVVMPLEEAQELAAHLPPPPAYDEPNVMYELPPSYEVSMLQRVPEGVAEQADYAAARPAESVQA